MGEYPEDEELEFIRKFEGNYHDLMDYVNDIWKYADIGYYKTERIIDEISKKPQTEYSLSTGGWSGNEEIIEAMMDNPLFWMFCWYSSKRGGNIRNNKEITF